jgi:hypothetical protein
VPSPSGWATGAEAEVGIYRVWSSSPNPVSPKGSRFLSLGKGSTTQLLVAVETNSVWWIDGCCDGSLVTRELYVGTPAAIEPFALLPSPASAVATLAADRALMHAGGRFHLLRPNQGPTPVPADVGPMIGLVATRRGVVYAADTNRLWRYLPAWPFSLTLDPAPLGSESTTLRLSGPDGFEVRIESSHDLRTWQPVATLTTKGNNTLNLSLGQAALWCRAGWDP